MGRRTWIKLYCEKWLTGTIREERPDIRSVWVDILTLAGDGEYGDTGEIKLSNGVGFTDTQIAEILNITTALWRKAKARFLETERITISKKGAIQIINWSKYQSEYQRQKRYRQQKDDNPTPEQKSPLTIPHEKEIEKESEKLQREVTTESYNIKLHDVNDSPEESLTSPHANQSTTPSDRDIPEKHRVSNLTKRISACLRDCGPLSVDDIRQVIGWPEDKMQSIRSILSQNKGTLFENERRGLWSLIEQK